MHMEQDKGSQEVCLSNCFLRPPWFGGRARAFVRPCDLCGLVGPFSSGLAFSSAPAFPVHARYFDLFDCSEGFFVDPFS